METYLFIAQKAFLREYTYRANVIFTVLRTLLGLFILVNVWTALYRGRPVVNGVGYEDIVFYTLIMTVLRNLSQSQVSDILNNKIRSGAIASDFIRPVSLMGSSLAEQVGANAFSTVFATLPILLAGALMFDLPAIRPLSLALFVVAALLGAIIMLVISWIIGMLSFWTRSAAFGSMLTRALTEIFGGAVVPLWFYPAPLRAVCEVLPFRLALFSPAAIAMQKVDSGEALRVIAFQLLWIFLLLALERLLWKQAQKVVTIQGG